MTRTRKFIRSVFLAPMMLLMQVEGGGAAGSDAGSATSLAANTSNSNPNAEKALAVPTAADIASEVIGAIEKRSQRLEGSITRAVADKYGMTDEEVNAILAAEKEKRDNALPADVQKKLDAAIAGANEKLVSAEIRVQAAALSFVDVSDACALIDRTSIKVTDKGEVTGVKEALQALVKAKPHLVKQQGAWGARQGSPAGAEPTVRDEIRNAIYGGKK